MKESQHSQCKESWRDYHPRCVCAVLPMLKGACWSSGAKTRDGSWAVSEHELWPKFAFSANYLQAVDSGAGGEQSTEPAGRASVKASVKIADALLEVLRENPQMTLAEVAVAVGRSVRAVEMASSNLVKAGRLRFVGPQKGGQWEVLQ